MQREKEEQRLNLCQKIANASEPVILSSTIHGFPSIVRTPRIFNKLVWVFFSLAAAVGCAFVIARTLSNFLDFEATSKIVIYNQDKVDFPTITICNVNPFVTQKANDFLHALEDEYNAYNIILETNLTMENQENETKKYINFLEIGKINIWLTNSTDYMMSMGYSFSELVIECKFINDPCNESDFEEFHDYEYGRCFRFNAGRNALGDSIELKTVTGAGEGAGLSMELFVGIQNSSDLLHSGSKHVGARIFVSNNTIRPSSTEGIHLPVNSHTNIGVTRTFSDRLGPPYSECKDDSSGVDSPIYAYIKSQNRTYRQNDCYELVIQDASNAICNCFLPNIENFRKAVKPCSLDNIISCSIHYGNITLNMINSNAKKFCPQACHSMVYDISYSLSGYPSLAYAQLLLLNPKIINKFSNTTAITAERLSSAILSFNVHYDLMTYTLISEAVSVSPIDLINNIGGTLGLFLGMSLLSFIEFVEIFIEIILVYFESKKQIRIKNSPISMEKIASTI